jgi:hypothetical protein
MSPGGQLNCIFNIIGLPTEYSDILHLDLVTANAIRDISPKIPKRNFTELFSHADEQGLDLLAKFIHFNPAKRISIDDAINNHTFLGQQQRRKYSLDISATSTSAIKMKFDINNDSISEEMLTVGIQDEINYYRELDVDYFRELDGGDRRSDVWITRETAMLINMTTSENEKEKI